MSSGLYGAIAAVSWGSADFIARFTGRGIGHLSALFGMFTVGAIVLSIIVWQQELPLLMDSSGYWLLLISGAGIMFSTLLLYWGLARGPVTIVAPIVGSYPLFNVSLAFILGSRLESVQWIAILVVIGGIWLVAQASSNFETDGADGEQTYSKKELKKTIGIALASSLGFGISIAAVQSATIIYGEVQTVCITRWIGLIIILLMFLGKREAPAVSISWWPLISLQGLLDAGAYLSITAGSHSDSPEITVVVASAFSAVTVILARVFLKEQMSWSQWGGVIMVVAGVGILSAF